MKRRILFFYLFFLPQIALLAQEQIEYKADRIKMVKNYKGGAKRLIGNAQFTTKEGMVMTCDSAYFLDNNTIEAYSNIFIRQGDSLTIVGNTAHYDGNTKLGIIEGDQVRCQEKDMILTTDYLNFDSKNKTASYQSGGTIVSKENTLTSKHGYYFSANKTVFFKYDVKLINPEYTMLADTLKYATESKTAIFLGPTNVISKKDRLYCEKGWYNTQTQISHLTKQAAIYTGHNIVYADSIHYDKNKETGHAFSHVQMIDTMQKTILSGNRSFSNQKKGIMWITGNALLTKAMSKDSLFVTADSMFAIQKKISLLKPLGLKDSLLKQDSIKREQLDSTSHHKKTHKVKREANLYDLYRADTSNWVKHDSSFIRAYHHVKIYKTDAQGLADTMVYSAFDSSLTLYHLPVLWHKENQLSGKKISLYFKNSKLDRVHIPENTFIVSLVYGVYFNQVKGKTLWAYFKHDTLKQITITGNAQAVYYLQNDLKILQGVNLIESSRLSILARAGKPDQITFIKKPKAQILPMRDLDVKAIEIKGFSWLEAKRPKSKEDLFKKSGAEIDTKEKLNRMQKQ